MRAPKCRAKPKGAVCLSGGAAARKARAILMSRLLPASFLALVACAGGTQNPGGQGEDQAPMPSCSVTADGAIAPDEMPLVPGIAVRYVRNSIDAPVDFDLQGAADASLGRWWDFSEGPSDIGATLVTADPAAAWYGGLFPGATFAAPISIELPQLVGVYRWESDADGGGELQLLGLTTDQEQEPAATTLVRYDEPVTTLRLPMSEGDTWGQQATFRDALIAGVPNQGVEDYLFEVDATGGAALEGGIEVEEVVRLRSQVTATYAVSLGESTTALHRLSWYAPCFGEIASVSGSSEELSPADELRRYYP